jgi:ribulose 1,5-bisphosphate carboxylase large subunit-like protein
MSVDVLVASGVWQKAWRLCGDCVEINSLAGYFVIRRTEKCAVARELVIESDDPGTAVKALDAMAYTNLERVWL